MVKSSSSRWSLLAVASLFPAWYIAAHTTNFIGDPIVVLRELPGFLTDSQTWLHVGVSSFRVYMGLIVGLIIGTFAALLMNRSPFWHRLLSAYVTLGLRTPSAIAAIVALSLFRGAEYGNIIVVAFITFPYLAMGLLTGLQSADRDLDGMARIYKMGTVSHAVHVLIPFIMPYMFSAIRNIHALAWKVIVAVEIFGAAKIGFGSQFSNAWNYFLITEIHLWLLVFMAVVIITEYCILRPAERHSFRWRDEA